MVDNNRMVMCETCEDWFHFDCIGLTDQQINRIDQWYCDTCCETYGARPVWFTKTPTSAQVIMKRKHYHEVDKIVGHRVERTGRHLNRDFLIRWKGCDSEDDTWEPEENLDGCLDTLQEYLKLNQLEYSSVEGLLGGDIDNEDDKLNWCKLKDIINLTLNQKESRFKNVDLTIKSWLDFEEETGIYFLAHDFHCYVILYLADKKYGFIADGGNVFINNETKNQEIRDLVKLRLRARQYMDQTKVDHCGSSAVIIAMMFIQGFAKKEFPPLMKPTTYWIKRIKSTMHKFESKTMDLPDLYKRQLRISCTYCGKTFRRNEGRKLHAHVLSHK